MINILPILKDQWGTMGDSSNTFSKGDFMVLYVSPVVLSGACFAFNWRMAGIGDLLTALSLMSGLLLNLLVLTFDVALRAAAQVENSAVESLATSPKIKLIRELQANSTYTLVISLLITVALAVGASMGLNDFNRWVTGILAYLIVHFLLMLAVVIKRIRAIFRNELIP
jgi:hypothetical protein